MKKLSRIIAVALTLCLLMAIVPGFACATGDGDADGLLISPVIISANLSTRAQAVSELYALEGEPAFMNDNVFTDVPAGSDAEKAIVWASGKGIVNGYGGGVFGPEDVITREQLLTILWRYAKYKEYDVSVGENTNILSYEDAFDISSFAVAPIQWACGEGIITGTDGYIKPLDGLTANELANIIDRFAYVYGLSSAAPEIAGGWAINTTCGNVIIPDEAREALSLAASELLGAEYAPIAYLGSQVVAGTNYAFLCKVTTVTPDPLTKLAVVVVYKDLDGAAEITDVNDVDITAYTSDSSIAFPGAGITGGWAIWNESTGLLPKSANDAFNAATAELTGVSYNPAALLGTQVVAGVNYAILCAATLLSSEPSTALAVVIVNAPVDGEASVLSVANFNIK